MPREPAFDIEVSDDAALGETLVIGVADFGVAGLTAVDYLTSHVETNQVGHVATRNVPDISPFSDGKPRWPIRLYDTETAELSVFISELFLPVRAADLVSDSLLQWVEQTDIREIVVLFGAPVAHTEEEHVVYGVGNEPFRTRHIQENDLEALSGGFFDGIVGELVTRGLEPDAPSTGVLVTPAHYPGPDLDAAIRLLDTVQSEYDIEIDEAELRERSREMKQYYQELADRLKSLQEGEGLHSRDFPEDRMYM